MMRQFKVGIIGATGMVGQRFVTLLAHHPWFRVNALFASARSAGKTYEEAVKGKWAMATPIPSYAKEMTVFDAADPKRAAGLDFVFCAVNMKKEEIRALEEEYAKREIPVVSNNSAHRFTPDVPMIIPEVNPEHLTVIEAQRKRLHTARGFIAVKSNCSLQSYVPLLHPLRRFGIEKAAVCTYQAISGAGKTFETMPEIIDNVIPYIGGEEEKLGKRTKRANRARRFARDYGAVPARARCRRTHGGGVRFLFEKADERRDFNRVENVCGRAAGAPPSFRPRALFAIPRRGQPPAAQARPHGGRRHGGNRRAAPRRYPFRL